MNLQRPWDQLGQFKTSDSVKFQGTKNRCYCYSLSCNPSDVLLSAFIVESVFSSLWWFVHVRVRVYDFPAAYSLLCPHMCPLLTSSNHLYVWIPVVKTHAAENSRLNIQIIWYNHLTLSSHLLTSLLALMNRPPFTALQGSDRDIYAA